MQVPLLVTLNLILQFLDGVATYFGWERWGEANPLIMPLFHLMGPGPALALLKIGACLLIVLLGRYGSPRLVPSGLAVVAVFYTIFSLIPWAACYTVVILG